MVPAPRSFAALRTASEAEALLRGAALSGPTSASLRVLLADAAGDSIESIGPGLGLQAGLDRGTPHRSLVLAAAIAAAAPGIRSAKARRIVEAVEADDELDPEADGPWIAGRLHVLVAELALVAGAMQPSARRCRAALEIADEIDDPVLAARAEGFLATLCALNAEYVEAEQHLASARGHAAVAGDVAGSARARYPMLTAESLIAAAAFDADRAERCAAEFETEPDSPLWAASAELARAMAEMLRGDLESAKVRLSRSLSSVQRSAVLDLVQGLSLGLLADLHLTEGSPQRAIGVLEGVPAALGDHVLCFSMQRSSALLAIGRPLEAARETAGCVRMGPRHCKRTYGPILLRRAVALRRLGRQPEALAAFREALGIIDATGSLTPYLTIPHEDLRGLIDAVLTDARSDAQAERLVGVLARLPGAPPERPRLTETERDIARELLEGGTLEEIARRRHVSLNTVKFHTRAIYRKLGAHDRGGAVAALAALEL